MRTCQMWLFVTGLKWSSGHLGSSNWVLLPSHFTFPSPDRPRWPPSLSPGSRTSWDYIWWRKSKSKDIWGWLCDWMVVGRQKVCPSLIRYNLKLSDGNTGGGGEGRARHQYWPIYYQIQTPTFATIHHPLFSSPPCIRSYNLRWIWVYRFVICF